MTRINCIPPSELTRQHLIAEYYELPRIWRYVQGAIARGEAPNDSRNPTSYTLGKGHCRFFYNKLKWLSLRHNSLCREMIKRGYRVNTYCFHLSERYDNISMEWYGDWKPTKEAMEINRHRIAERLAS